MSVKVMGDDRMGMEMECEFRVRSVKMDPRRVGVERDLWDAERRARMRLLKIPNGAR